MLPKKQTPLVRAETICCTLAAVIVANVLQILRDHKDRKDEK